MTTFTDQELSLEKLMADLGSERYKAAVAKAVDKEVETTHAPGRMLLARACTAMAAEVSTWMAGEKGRRGRPSQAYSHLSDYEPDLLATLACKVVLDSISRRRTFAATARAIARAVEDESRIRYFRATLPKVWRQMKRKFKSADKYASKRRIVSQVMRKLAVDWTPWGHNERIRTGITLLDMFVHSTNLVKTIKQFDHKTKKVQMYVAPLDATLEWLEKSHEAHEAMFPFYMPMLQAPEPWTSLFDGGYATNLIRQMPVIKLRNRKAISEAEDADLLEVFEAVNTLQHTKWEINPDVHEVVKHFWAQSTPVADLPDREDIELPPKPITIDSDEDARRAWKRSAAKVYDANVAMRSKRVQSSRIIFMASQFENEHFYFPYSCDFRGRVYPVPYFLQPQGPSLARGLLRFAEGKPIGSENNAQLFLVHGANTWGYDKASLAERAAWVLEHEPQITEVANDPIENRWWAEADKPWEFLAFCIEFAEWRAVGPTFVSRIPVSMDGSNNGLQIFSLLLRDEHGGAATNCSPSTFPQDIYQRVADRVTNVLLDDSQSKRSIAVRRRGIERVYPLAPWATRWLSVSGGALPRSATKRSVMTLPYGATKFSCQEYLLQWYADVAPDNPFGDDNFRSSWYLTGLVWAAIEQEVVSARAGMAWLRAVAKLACEEKKPIIWTSPSGFPVRQEYKKTKEVEVATAIGDRVRFTRIHHDKDALAARKQVNGISPNFVHSLDAAALIKTVNACDTAGIQSFAMVHDSFGCLAGDSSQMAQILRSQYASMFSHDILADFRDQLQNQLEAPLPPLPPYGTLDPEVVRDSPYFFA